MDDPGVIEAARRYAHGLTNVPGQQYSARSPQRQAVATLAAQMMENEGITPEQREEMWRRTSAGRIGEGAAARTGATMGVRIESATGEVARLMPLALSSARDVANIADFNSVPLQALRNAWLQGTSDPRFEKFLVNNESLLRAWVRAMNPTGQPRVGQEVTARAEGVLSKAVGLRGYEAMLEALWQEVQASREAVEDVRAGRAPPNPFEGTTPSAPAVPGAPRTYPGVRSIQVEP